MSCIAPERHGRAGDLTRARVSAKQHGTHLFAFKRSCAVMLLMELRHHLARGRTTVLLVLVVQSFGAAQASRFFIKTDVGLEEGDQF